MRPLCAGRPRQNGGSRNVAEPGDRNSEMARAIAEKVAAEGGRSFFVGGMVRDRIVGRESKDVDIEIHGITPQKLAEILSSLGDVTRTGASFGVFGLKTYDIDVAMPGKETASCRGFREFERYADPFIGYEKAAARRDFTMNAMMEDVLTGELLDFFGGQADLKMRVIRHVKDQTFRQDALRVLRAAQFAARFQFRVAEETRGLARTISLREIAPERILGELNKALLKAEKPSLFFEELRRMQQLSCWFPEAEALIGVPQSPVYHPEGDVWVHTMMVLDAAAQLRSAAAYPEGFMLSALAHDFGKAVSTTIEGDKVRSIGHEQSGAGLAKRFLGRISRENRLERYVLNMVELHMEPNRLAGAKAREKSTARMFDRSVCPEDLLLLARADHFGKGAAGPYDAQEIFLRERLAQFRELMARPYVQGRDLVERGFEPGADFGEALSFAHKLRLAGVPKESALAQTEAYIRKRRNQT